MFFRCKVEKGQVNEYFLEEFDAIVIGGGGLKGLAFLGAIQFFAENDLFKNVKTFAGTSAGALICLLLVLGYSPTEQLQMNLETSFLKMKPLNEILSSSSLLDFSLLIQKLDEVCRNKMNKSPTFQELFEYSGKSLRVVAFNVSKNSQHLFSEKETPDVLVVDAVRFSCSLPLVFEPQISDWGDLFFDGGLINNLPVDVVLDSDRIFVVSTGSSAPLEGVALSFSDIVQIVISVPTVSSDLLRIERIKTEYPEKTLFHVDIKNSYSVSATLGMSNEEKLNCFKTGYNFAKGI